jgi:hypothetical protein
LDHKKDKYFERFTVTKNVKAKQEDEASEESTGVIDGHKPLDGA